MKKTLLIFAVSLTVLGLNAQGTWKATGSETKVPVSAAIDIFGIPGLIVMHNDASDEGVIGRTDNDVAPAITYNGVTWNNLNLIQGVTNGMFFAFSPSADGTLDLSIKTSSGRNTYVAETDEPIATVAAKTITASDTKGVEKATNPTFPDVYDTYNNTTAKWSNTAAINTSGAMQYMVMSFSVKAGKTYIVGFTSSKLMLRGIHYALASSVSTPNTDKPVASVRYFDVLGKEVPADSKGLIFVKTLYKDGTSDVQKFYKK